ncbi:MAG: CinA family protein [Clostridiales bacterium]|nr:CinA family protein [Clostridiales bacterium]MCD8368065.1 CinA family protein [Clostridiales bacterium]
MGRTIQEQVYERLLAHGKTLSTAESCTGGLVAAAMTEVSGVSQVFKGGVVSYWTEVKGSVLGVSPETLERYGAVSPQTAGEMALGAARLMGSSLAVSVTGVAGPNPDERGNPVGTLYLGLSDGARCWVRHPEPEALGATRQEIRASAVRLALEFVLEYA